MKKIVDNFILSSDITDFLQNYSILIAKIVDIATDYPGIFFELGFHKSKKSLILDIRGDAENKKID